MMNLGLWADYCRGFFEYADKKEVDPIDELLEEETVPTKNPFLQISDVWHEIKAVIKYDKIYFLSLVGSQGKGKSTLSSIFATMARQDGYETVYAMPEDFIEDMDGWIKRIKEKYQDTDTDKFCFILDDLSYAMEKTSRKKQSLVKNVIARIRHEFEEPVNGKMVQKPIFIIYITHRLHAAPPMLRNAASWIFPTMQHADRADLLKIISNTKEDKIRMEKIYRFISWVSIEGTSKGFFNYKIGNTVKKFVWGNEDDPGDGRLMVSWHSGELRVLQSQVIPNMIDLEATRIKIPIKTEDEKLDEFRSKAEQMFSKPKGKKPKHIMPTFDEILEHDMGVI